MGFNSAFKGLEDCSISGMEGDTEVDVWNSETPSRKIRAKGVMYNFRKCAVVLFKLTLLIPNMKVDAVYREQVECK
jgi:hypothetical protein